MEQLVEMELQRDPRLGQARLCRAVLAPSARIVTLGRLHVSFCSAGNAAPVVVTILFQTPADFAKFDKRAVLTLCAGAAICTARRVLGRAATCS